MRHLQIAAAIIALAGLPHRASALTGKDAGFIITDASESLTRANRRAERKLSEERGGSRRVRALGRFAGRAAGATLGLLGGGTLGAAMLAGTAIDTTTSEMKDVEAKVDIDGQEHQATLKLKQPTRPGILYTVASGVLSVGLFHLLGPHAHSAVADVQAWFPNASPDVAAFTAGALTFVGARATQGAITTGALGAIQVGQLGGKIGERLAVKSARALRSAR
jgi:hypothetical protein